MDIQLGMACTCAEVGAGEEINFVANDILYDIQTGVRYWE
jgi:hypothetical protein